MSDYSRGDYADLPAGTTDLENNYTAPDLTAIASNDNSTYAEQTANNEIAIHQYKKTVTGQYTNITWSGKSSLAPSESPVILEVYNVTGTPAWEELDRDDSTAADTDFDLSYDNLATADYLDSGVITWRVYQAASAGDIYWPSALSGITKPQHLYPFSQTGNYSDQGSVGGLDLTAAGSGNSFSNGLVLNGSGHAYHAGNAGLCNVGSAWSILIDLVEANYNSPENNYCIGTGSDGYGIRIGSRNVYFAHFTDNFYFGNIALTDTNRYQIIVTCYNGTKINLYINGTHVESEGTMSFAIADNISEPFYIGRFFLEDLTYNVIGTIKNVGILIGTTWSGTDITAIYNAIGAL